MPVDPRDPTSWPPDTIVVRCGSAHGVHELAERLSQDGSWSVFTGAGAVMITLQADFNHMDARGRLRLGDLRMHQQTPFAEIAAKHETIIFVDGDDMVRGELIHDPAHGWIGQVDWSTQDVWESYPPAVGARG